MATRRSERAASHASPAAPASRGRRSAAPSPLTADLPAVEGVAIPRAEAPSWALPQLTGRATPSRDAVDALALSVDGARLFTAGGARGAIRCYSSAELGAPRLLWEAQANGHTGGVTALAVALDDRGVFSAGRDGEIRRWSSDGALADTLRGHGEGGVTCLVAHGETLVSGGDEGKVRTWHAGTGEQGRTLRGDGCRVTALRLSPGGERVASGGSDRSVRVFNITTGQAIAELTGHGGWVSALAWAANGLALLSGSYDGDVRVWATPMPGGGQYTLRGLLRAQPADADGEPRSTAPEDRMVAAIMVEPRAPRRCVDGDHNDDDAMDIDEAAAAFEADEISKAGEAHRVYVGTMDGGVAMWNVLERRREDWVGAGAGAAVCALSHCADAGGQCPALCVSAHHDGSLRAWRRVRSRRAPTGCGLEEAWSLRGAHADWATQLAPSRLPAALRGDDPGAPMLLFSAGEDGALATWRVAAPRAWSRAAHSAYPDGFRAAVVAFLCTLQRMTATGVAAEAEEAAATARDGVMVPAVPPRLRRSAKGGSASASPASPLSPEPCGECSHAPRRGRRALMPVPPVEVRATPLRLHGATRDALVDLVVSALARQAYPVGRYTPGSLR